MLWILGDAVVLLVQGRGEMVILPAVTAELLHPSSVETGTVFNDVSTG